MLTETHPRGGQPAPQIGQADELLVEVLELRRELDAALRAKDVGAATAVRVKARELLAADDEREGR